MLSRNGHQVVEVLVGKCSNRQLPTFFRDKVNAPVRLFNSPSLDYGKKGRRGRILKSIFLNTTPDKLFKWRRSVELIKNRIDETAPDVIVNFYEMLFSVANLLHRFRIPIVCIGHQFLLEHPNYSYRSLTEQGQFALRLNNMLCSLGATKIIALSYYPLKNCSRERVVVLPPLLRGELFNLKSETNDYILGYMLNTAYMEDLRRWKSGNPSVTLHVFWDKKDSNEQEEIAPGLFAHRLSDTKFLSLMQGCRGYVTTAGFESICEALYLEKPVLMIPTHIEQEINAEDARGIGAGIISNEFNVSKLLDFIPSYSGAGQKYRDWVNSAEGLFLQQLTTLG